MIKLSITLTMLYVNSRTFSYNVDNSVNTIKVIYNNENQHCIATLFKGKAGQRVIILAISKGKGFMYQKNSQQTNYGRWARPDF